MPDSDNHLTSFSTSIIETTNNVKQLITANVKDKTNCNDLLRKVESILELSGGQPLVAMNGRQSTDNIPAVVIEPGADSAVDDAEFDQHYKIEICQDFEDDNDAETELDCEVDVKTEKHNPESRNTDANVTGHNNTTCTTTVKTDGTEVLEIDSDQWILDEIKTDCLSDSDIDIDDEILTVTEDTAM